MAVSAGWFMTGRRRFPAHGLIRAACILDEFQTRPSIVMSRKLSSIIPQVGATKQPGTQMSDTAIPATHRTAHHHTHDPQAARPNLTRGTHFSAIIVFIALLAVDIGFVFAACRSTSAPPVIFACTGVSFANGSNDGQKGMGMIC
jgi:hypothetical protein